MEEGEAASIVMVYPSRQSMEGVLEDGMDGMKGVIRPSIENGIMVWIEVEESGGISNPA